MMKAEKFHPYKLQFTQELLEGDQKLRVGFCQKQLTEIQNDPDFLSNIFFTDEAHIDIQGRINHQNFRLWNNENPHLHVEVNPVHLCK
jgi:hypothetical protein